MSWISNRDGRRDEEGKGILWKLPVVNNKDLGKLGPGFGAGVGCGVGFGIGLFGGVCFGFGAGFPGLQIGFGVGGGCGIGIGFGYGIGRGVGYDEHKKYSNAGKMFGNSGNLLPGSVFLLSSIFPFSDPMFGGKYLNFENDFQDAAIDIAGRSRRFHDDADRLRKKTDFRQHEWFQEEASESEQRTEII